MRPGVPSSADADALAPAVAPQAWWRRRRRLLAIIALVVVVVAVVLVVTEPVRRRFLGRRARQRLPKLAGDGAAAVAELADPGRRDAWLHRLRDGGPLRGQHAGDGDAGAADGHNRSGHAGERALDAVGRFRGALAGARDAGRRRAAGEHRVRGRQLGAGRRRRWRRIGRQLERVRERRPAGRVRAAVDGHAPRPGSRPTRSRCPPPSIRSRPTRRRSRAPPRRRAFSARARRIRACRRLARPCAAGRLCSRSTVSRSC